MRSRGGQSQIKRGTKGRNKTCRSVMLFWSGPLSSVVVERWSAEVACDAADPLWVCRGRWRWRGQGSLDGSSFLYTVKAKRLIRELHSLLIFFPARAVNAEWLVA